TDFRRMVVFDVAAAADTDGGVELEMLMRYLLKTMDAAFELHLNDVYHPEKIAQILKDEEKSLFCFLNVEFLTQEAIQRLRDFTQGVHRVLYCGQNDSLAAYSLP